MGEGPEGVFLGVNHDQRAESLMQRSTNTEFGVVTRMWRRGVLGVSHAIAYCANASRGCQQ